MCTAIGFQTREHYFGRNLDLEYRYHEQVTVTPRRFWKEPRYAMIGMATVADGYPLYYDATNEHGLSMAGLNFPDNAVYRPRCEGKHNVASYALIPWVLGRCRTVDEARRHLALLNVTDERFSEAYPPTPLHWLLADREQSVVIEPLAEGVRVWDNPFGVLTNNPPFDYHLHNLSNYLNVTRQAAVNRFADGIKITAYSNGMGGIGLPGDFSSASRFIKAAFVRANAVCEADEESSVSQFFHMLTAVEQVRGCVQIGDAYEITLYSSCCNTDRGIYYFTTYDDRQIAAVRLHDHDVDGTVLTTYDLPQEQTVRYLSQPS